MTKTTHSSVSSAISSTMCLGLLLLGLLAGGVARAQNAVVLVPVVNDVAVGRSIEILVVFQSFDMTLGGGVQVGYDPNRVRFDRFEFDPTLAMDPELSLQPLGGSSENALLIAFGDYAGVSGTHLIGRLYFTAIAKGTAEFSAAVDDQRAGGFANETGGLLPFAFGSTSVEIVAGWQISQQLLDASGNVQLDFTIGSPAASVFSTYLVLIHPQVQVIPLWQIPLPGIDPPIQFSVPLPIPFLPGVIFYSELLTGQVVQAADVDWVEP